MSQWESVPTTLDDNTKKFLDFLSKAEGADYNTIVGGGRFDKFDAHPNVVGLRTKEGPSTAAGRYQITNTTYNDIAPKLGIKDFSPESQDRIAIELIKRGGALEDVQKGDFISAVNKLGGTWASLPSSPYSQPKKSMEWVEKALDLVVSPANAKPMSQQNQWEDVPVQSAQSSGTAPATGGGWEDVPVAQPRTTGEELVRQGGLTARYGLQGAEKAFTFPVRAVFEAVGAGAEMLGAKDTGQKIRNTLGMGGNAGRVVADAVNLPKPEGALEKFVGGATETVAGLGVGGAAQKVAENAPAVTQNAVKALLPTASTGKEAATFTALGGALEVAPVETAAALALVTAGKGAYDSRKLNQAVDKIIKNAGNNTIARTDAEIIKRMGEVADDPIRFLGGQAPETLSTKTLNQAVAKSFLDPVKKILDDLPKGEKPQNLKQLRQALEGWEGLSQAQRDALRGTPYGDAVVDAIEKSLRASVLTGAQPAKGGAAGMVARAGVNATPSILSAFTGIPVIISGDFIRGLGNKIGGRATREDVSRALLKPRTQEAADIVLQRLGRGNETFSAARELADRAVNSNAAKIAAQQAAKTARLAEEAKNLQALDATMGRLGVSSRSGPLRTFESGFGLSSKEIDDVVKNLGTQSPEIKPILDKLYTPDAKFTRKEMFKLSDILEAQTGKTFDRGLLSNPQGVLSGSGIRNPISYEANVKTAKEAAQLARDTAPSSALAQFANRVAGTKDPAEKLRLVEERLAKATDPREIEYLNTIVRPLTNFGKK